MAKGLPIKIGTTAERTRLSVVDELPASGDARVLEISDFKDEMRGCIELDQELDRYFAFLSNLSREELLAIVKYEVYNRVLLQQNLDFSSEKTDE